jgi:hypothetical protein
VEHLGGQHPRQRVDGSHAEIDLAGDDHEGHAHGHDGEEAGVLGQLGEVLGVEELVHPFFGGGAVSIGVLGEDSPALAIGSGFNEGALDRSAEQSQQRSQDKDHEQQPRFSQSQVLRGDDGAHVPKVRLLPENWKSSSFPGGSNGRRSTEPYPWSSESFGTIPCKGSLHRRFSLG